METEAEKILKSVIETLIKKEAPKFKSLIQKELASRIHTKVEELKKALSGEIVTGVADKKAEPVALPENLPGAPSAPVGTPSAAPRSKSKSSEHTKSSEHSVYSKWLLR